MITKEHINFALKVSLIFALGFITTNQAFHYFYDLNRYSSPCDACAEISQQYRECLDIPDPNAPVLINYSASPIGLLPYQQDASEDRFG